LEEIEAEPDAKGLESAFKTAKQKQVGAIMTPTGRRFFAERKRIAELAGKYRLPLLLETLSKGGQSTGRTSVILSARCLYVDKIFKGAKLMSCGAAHQLEFVINLRAAKQIGLFFARLFRGRIKSSSEPGLLEGEYSPQRRSRRQSSQPKQQPLLDQRRR
jgi:hypothetical protein